jgi:hypothetical protein
MSVVPGTRLDSSVPIAVLEPLRRVNAALLDLLDGFDAKDWYRPTVHKDRDVKDLAAHLLHGSMRRVSSLRDAYQPPPASLYHRGGTHSIHTGGKSSVYERDVSDEPADHPRTTQIL